MTEVAPMTRASCKRGANVGQVKFGDVVAGRVALRASKAAAHADPREQARRGLLSQAAAHEAQFLLDKVETGICDPELQAGLLVDVAQGEDHAVLGEGELNQLRKDGISFKVVAVAPAVAVLAIVRVVILLLLLGQSVVVPLCWAVAVRVQDVAEERRHLICDPDVSDVWAVLIVRGWLIGGDEAGMFVDRARFERGGRLIAPQLGADVGRYRGQVQGVNLRSVRPSEWRCLWSSGQAGYEQLVLESGLANNDLRLVYVRLPC